ncbi:MAG: hypothetical protein ACI9LM_004732 [Alteromonadaceae bacterium]|jgi:hypothetical protein
MDSLGKIFIIGLPRTGTTSVCSALLTLGYYVAHTAYTQRTFEQAEVIADTPIFCDYPILDSYYPNSRFIYLERAPHLWIPSIKQLLLRMQKNMLRTDGGFNTIIKRCYQEIFTPFTADNIQDDKFLLDCYEQHQKTVTTYFSKRPQDLLSIDISKESSYAQLLSFLALDEGAGNFQQMNVGGKVTAWNDLKNDNKISSTNRGKITKVDYFQLQCERAKLNSVPF